MDNLALDLNDLRWPLPEPHEATQAKLGVYYYLRAEIILRLFFIEKFHSIFFEINTVTAFNGA